MSGKVERKQRTRQSILDAAARLVRRRGIAGARIVDVMEAAGLTVGGFYAHFGSKDELIDATLRRAGLGLRSRLFDGIDELPPGERAFVLIDRYLSTAHRDRGSEGLGCALPAVTSEVGTTATAHRPVLGEQLDLLMRKLEAHLPATVRAPRLTAVALMALMYGGLSLARALGGSPLSDEVLTACRTLGRQWLGGDVSGDASGDASGAVAADVSADVFGDVNLAPHF
jgi:TetR/AcrR family transcriptional repressor of nem operon